MVIDGNKLIEKIITQEGYEEFLQGLKSREMIKGYSDVHVKPLWDTWTLGQKMTWFIKMKFNYGRQEYNMYHTVRGIISTVLSMIEDGDMDKDKVLEKYDELHEKFWMEEQPKAIILVDYKLQPMQPLEYVEIKFNLDDNGNIIQENKNEIPDKN